MTTAGLSHAAFPSKRVWQVGGLAHGGRGSSPAQGARSGICARKRDFTSQELQKEAVGEGEGSQSERARETERRSRETKERETEGRREPAAKMQKEKQRPVGAERDPANTLHAASPNWVEQPHVCGLR